MDELNREIGTEARLKLTGIKIMIIGKIIANPMYNIPESGYLIRLSTTLQEIFVRTFELEDWDN